MRTSDSKRNVIAAGLSRTDVRTLRPYLVGLGLVVACSLVKLAFPPLGREVPFVLYFAPPLVAALIGGRWPGLVTAFAAMAAANFFFLGKPNEFSFIRASVLQCAVFLLEATVLTWVCDALVQARSGLLAEKDAQLALAARERELLASERHTRDVLEQEQRRFRAVFEHSLDGMFLFADDRLIVDANPASCSLLGRTRDEIVGHTTLEFLPNETKREDSLAEFEQAGFVSRQDRHVAMPDGSFRLVELNAAANITPGLHLVSFRDIENRKRAEDALRFLGEAGRVLSSSLDYDETLATVTRLAVPRMADWAAVDIFEPETKTLRRVAVAHVDPAKVALAHQLHDLRPPSLDAPTGVPHVIRTGESSLTPLITDEMLVRALSDDPKSLAILREIGLVSIMIVPLPVRGANRGAITFASSESRRRFTLADVAFAQEIASRAGGAVETALAHGDRVRFAEAERDILRESTAWFRALAETTPQIVRTLDADGNVTYANARWAEYTGLDDSAVWQHVLHPDDRDRVVGILQEALGTKQNVSMEFRVRRRDGSYRWFLGLATCVRDRFGDVTMWVSSWTDIEDQVRTRAGSERLYRLTSALASTMTTASVAEQACSVAAATVGSDSTTFYVLDETRQALVLQAKYGDREDLAGYARIPVDMPVPLARIVSDGRPRFFESHEAVAAESPAIAAALNGNPFHAWAQLPLMSAAGNALGIISFAFRQPRTFGDEDRQLMTAVADQCAVAVDRARAYEAEAVALRKKDEFLAMLGHELRNPLAPILTATSLLRMRGVGAERELGILERQGRHLVRLVDDLLDVARVTSGKLTLQRQPIELGAVVGQALESARKGFEDKQLRVEVDVRAEGLRVDGDRDRLVQVVTNLLVNAAKFTPPQRSVYITATSTDADVLLEVRDEGEGIAPELLPHVFDLFAQGRQALDRREGGLGLGLAIARSIVEAHGGAIEAKSGGRNHGATIAVRLPISSLSSVTSDQISTTRDRPSPDTAAPRGRILLVDDNIDGAEVLADYLATLGYETSIAHDGPGALSAVDGALPDAAVIDIGLPGMDGYELAEELRGRLGDRAPALIALTGYAQASDRERALRHGFHAHFAKPVDLEKLAVTIEGLVRDV